MPTIWQRRRRRHRQPRARWGMTERSAKKIEKLHPIPQREFPKYERIEPLRRRSVGLTALRKTKRQALAQRGARKKATRKRRRWGRRKV